MNVPYKTVNARRTEINTDDLETGKISNVSESISKPSLNILTQKLFQIFLLLGKKNMNFRLLIANKISSLISIRFPISGTKPHCQSQRLDSISSISTGPTIPRIFQQSLFANVNNKQGESTWLLNLSEHFSLSYHISRSSRICLPNLMASSIRQIIQ